MKHSSTPSHSEISLQNQSRAVDRIPAGSVSVIPRAPKSIEKLMESFLAGRNFRTQQAYCKDLEDFRISVGASTVQEATRLLIGSDHGDANGLVLDYRNHLVSRGLKSATINRRLAAVRSLVKLANTLGYISWTLDIGGVKSQKYRDTRGPGKAGVREMLREIEVRKDQKGIRDVAILRMLYDLGLRRSELTGLDLGDIDIQNGTVAVLGKGKTEKIILSLPEPTKLAVTAWLTTRGSEPGPVFTNFDHRVKGSRLTGASIYRLVREMGEKVGVKVRPHGLRHTAITEACKAAQNAGLGLEEVLDFSRHKDVRTLMVYRDREKNVQGQLATLIATAI